MKRSASASPPSSPIITPKAELDSDFDSEGNDNYAPSPSPPTKSKAKSSPKKPRSTPTKQPKSAQSTPTKPQGPWSPGWSPDKKEAIIERYISIGIKGSNLSEMCREFNLTKPQLQNAIQAGHKNNLRDKAAKSVRN